MMRGSEPYDEIILVLKGGRDNNFSHAATFIAFNIRKAR